MDQAVARCTDAIDHGQQMSIGVINAAKVVSMQRNPQLRQAVADCDMVLADGQAVVWASRILGAPLPERVAGIDLFMKLLAVAEQRGDRVYFLGARPDVLARMLEQAGRLFPGLLVAGAHDGYYQAGEEAEIAEDIRRCQTDILFVGMSSPRKELFLDEWGTATKAHVVHGVGGSFDILAGLTRGAPLWYQEHGLEWLYRAYQEPVRLGRRYLTTNLSFMALVRARDAAPGPGCARTRQESAREHGRRRGLGYVGLPLAMRAAEVGHQVVGYDVDEARVKLLAAGESYIEDVPSGELKQALDSGTVPAVDRRARLRRFRRRRGGRADTAARRAARPHLPGERRPHPGQVPAPGGDRRRRVHLVPGHHPGDGAAAARGGIRA